MKKNDIIFYIVLAAVGITLYATGKHTEVIGFAQRGLLATGLFNPNTDPEDEEENTRQWPEADYRLQLKDVNGETVSLEDHRGKVIFLNIWATWCPPCIAELPGIEALHEEMGDEVVFILLSQDRDFTTAVNFMKRKEYDLPIYTAAGPTPPTYQSRQIPTTYIIDKQGNLRLKHSGMADYDSEKFQNFMQRLVTGDRSEK